MAARRVVANANPKIVAKLAGGKPWPEAFANYQCESATFRMNVALSELPDFACLPGKAAAPHHSSGIILAPTLAYMDRAHATAREEGWSREPIVEMLIPSTVDDSLAPRGAHVASLFCQHFRYALPGGRRWEDERERAADAVIDLVTRHAPNFRAAVIARRILSPLGPRARVRPHRRRHLPRQAHAQPALQRAPRDRLRQLPDAAGGALPLRVGRAPGRGRHRRPGPQRRAGSGPRLAPLGMGSVPTGS